MEPTFAGVLRLLPGSVHPRLLGAVPSATKLDYGAGKMKRQHLALAAMVVVNLANGTFGFAIRQSPEDAQPRSAAARACDSGDMDACIVVAREYSLSLQPADLTQALQLYERACDGGSAIACQAAGGMLASEPLGRTDRQVLAGEYFARARAMYSTDCHRGNAAGCANLVEMHHAGQIKASKSDVSAWNAKVRSLYGAECDAGVAAACAALASYCARREDGRCFVSAHRKACDLGTAGACCVVGRVYREGSRGSRRNGAAAVQYLERACMGGDVSCCRDAAVEHQSGKHVRKSSARAVLLYERGCDGNQAESCWDVGVMLQVGNGVCADSERAARLLERACSLGLKDACRP